MFPEGTRTRPGPLGKPHRGVGRLALETGAPVVPVAMIGTEDIRRGWRIRPRKVRLRAGRRLQFPTVENASPALAGAVTDRIWPMVMLQWEWLGGLPPIRRAAIIGAGAWGTSLAVLLSRAGLEVELGCRTPSRPQPSRPRARTRLSAGSRATRGGPRRARRRARARPAPISSASPSPPARCRAFSPRTASGFRAAPACSCCPRGSCRRWGRCRRRSSPSAARPAPSPCSADPPHAAEVLEHGASVVLATVDRGFARQLADVLAAAGLDVSKQPRRNRGRAGRLPRRTSPCSPPPWRRSPARTSPAPPPARCSPRSTRSRGRAEDARRRSQASPAPATWSRPSSRRAPQPSRRRAARSGRARFGDRRRARPGGGGG